MIVGESYRVSKERLLELLEAELTLQALENGGVDSWEWCEASIFQFTGGQDISDMAEEELIEFQKE